MEPIGQLDGPPTTPKVSVVIPVHNGATYLDEALRSVRDQTLRELEIIVVDDGSTDDSLAIAERHAALDPRVRPIAQQNQGVAAARNTGVATATAPWVALLDSDDVALPHRLERQLAFLSQHPDVKVLGCHGLRIGSGGQELGVFDVGPRDHVHFERLRSAHAPIYLLASSVMFSRAEALALGGFREQWATEDVDLWTRMADRDVVVALPERLVLYRIHSGSASNAVFFRQMEATVLISVNARRRRAGMPEMELGELQKRLRRQPAGRRARRLVRWSSQYCYRLAGGYLANRNPRGLLWLAASAAMWPPVPFGRISRQIIPWLRSKIESNEESSGLDDKPAHDFIQDR